MPVRPFIPSAVAKAKANGTPLDALFQMTTKDFDESQGKHLTKRYTI